jgi:hypothetical protein
MANRRTTRFLLRHLPWGYGLVPGCEHRDRTVPIRRASVDGARHTDCCALYPKTGGCPNWPQAVAK